MAFRAATPPPAMEVDKPHVSRLIPCFRVMFLLCSSILSSRVDFSRDHPVTCFAMGAPNGGDGGVATSGKHGDGKGKVPLQKGKYPAHAKGKSCEVGFEKGGKGKDSFYKGKYAVKGKGKSNDFKGSGKDAGVDKGGKSNVGKGETTTSAEPGSTPLPSPPTES